MKKYQKTRRTVRDADMAGKTSGAYAMSETQKKEEP